MTLGRTLFEKIIYAERGLFGSLDSGNFCFFKRGERKGEREREREKERERKREREREREKERERVSVRERLASLPATDEFSLALLFRVFFFRHLILGVVLKLGLRC